MHQIDQICYQKVPIEFYKSIEASLESKKYNVKILNLILIIITFMIITIIERSLNPKV